VSRDPATNDVREGAPRASAIGPWEAVERARHLLPRRRPQPQLPRFAGSGSDDERHLVSRVDAWNTRRTELALLHSPRRRAAIPRFAANRASPTTSVSEGWTEGARNGMLGEDLPAARVLGDGRARRGGSVLLAGVEYPSEEGGDHRWLAVTAAGRQATIVGNDTFAVLPPIYPPPHMRARDGARWGWQSVAGDEQRVGVAREAARFDSRRSARSPVTGGRATTSASPRQRRGAERGRSGPRSRRARGAGNFRRRTRPDRESILRREFHAPPCE